MRYKFCSFLFFAGVFFVYPSFSFAGIVINEIMYDTSGTDSGREWVELYNNDSTSVDISNYKFLESIDASNHGLTSVSGNSILAPSSFAVIVSDFTKFLIDNPNYSGVLLKASFGSLSNTGSTLLLKSGTTIIDQVTYTSSLGAAGTGNSLQKTSNGFIPASPTPGLPNALIAVLESTGGSSGGTGGSSTTTSDTGTTTSTTSTTTTSISNSGSIEVLSAHSSTKIVTYVVENPALKADAGRHRITTTDVPIEFEAGISGLAGNVSYDWSFGDGTTGSGKIVNHSYMFGGDYVVVLNIYNGVDRAVSRTEVKVVSPNVKIVSTINGPRGYVELQNNGQYEINIQNWKLRSGNNELTFPRDTLVKAGSSVKFPFKFDDISNFVSLVYGDNIVADSYGANNLTATTAYTEPTKEQIELAKTKVAKQFALEEQNSEIFKADKDKLNTPTLSIIDRVTETKAEDDSLLLATPVRFFKFLKNFFSN